MNHGREISTIINCVKEENVALQESDNVNAEVSTEETNALVKVPLPNVTSVEKKKEEFEKDLCNQSESERYQVVFLSQRKLVY